jgi:hypothetical protein
MGEILAWEMEARPLRKPALEDVLNVVREILRIHAGPGAGWEPSRLRREAVEVVASRELSDERFCDDKSAQASIRDACSRRLKCGIEIFDDAVAALLSEDIVPMEALLTAAHGYANHHATLASLTAQRRMVGRAYRRADEDAAVANRDPFDVDPTKIDRGNRGHATTQNALADFLRGHGIEPRSPQQNECDFDIAWEHADTIFVGEVKSITDANEERQLRLGIGQVLRYRQALSVRHAKVASVLVPEREPRDSSWAELCREVGVLLVWPGSLDSVLPGDVDRQRSGGTHSAGPLAVRPPRV